MACEDCPYRQKLQVCLCETKDESIPGWVEKIDSAFEEWIEGNPFVLNNLGHSIGIEMERMAKMGKRKDALFLAFHVKYLLSDRHSSRSNLKTKHDRPEKKPVEQSIIP